MKYQCAYLSRSILLFSLCKRGLTSWRYRGLEVYPGKGAAGASGPILSKGATSSRSMDNSLPGQDGLDLFEILQKAARKRGKSLEFQARESPPDPTGPTHFAREEYQ